MCSSIYSRVDSISPHVRLNKSPKWNSSLFDIYPFSMIELLSSSFQNYETTDNKVKRENKNLQEKKQLMELINKRSFLNVYESPYCSQCPIPLSIVETNYDRFNKRPLHEMIGSDLRICTGFLVRMLTAKLSFPWQQILLSFSSQLWMSWFLGFRKSFISKYIHCKFKYTVQLIIGELSAIKMKIILC